MANFFIITIIFAFLYALKGGSGKDIFPWWSKFRSKNKFTERLLDGKIISTAGAFLFALFFNVEIVSISGGAFGVPEYAVRFIPAVLFALGWLASVAPSMGEEHGAVGRISYWWGPYIDKGFGREYGIKKALQRGVWMGAIMALVTGYIPFICFSLLFVPSIFIGQEIVYRLTGRDGWSIAEPIIGALVFGLPCYFWLM